MWRTVTREAQGLHPAQGSDDYLPGRTHLNSNQWRSTLREGTRRQDQEEGRGHFSWQVALGNWQEPEGLHVMCFNVLEPLYCDSGWGLRQARNVPPFQIRDRLVSAETSMTEQDRYG